MLAASDLTILALRLFQRSFGETAAQQQFTQFLARLEKSGLQWILDKMRSDVYPPNPGLEEGLPEFFYYFIPGTLWGTDGPPPTTPLAPDFTARADGVGLDFGCPIRLHAALKVLERFEPQFDGASSEELRTNHKHLPKVEELIWGDAWELPTDRRTYGNGNKLPDWRMVDATGDILIEAKFLPSDWARFVDGPAHRPKECMRRAAAQFPLTPPSTTLNVVAFTGFADMDGPLGETFAEEMAKYPHIHAVIYRGFRSDTWIFSRSELPIKRLSGSLRLECMNDYQPFYPFTWIISEKESRAIERQKLPALPHQVPGSRGTLYYKQIPLTCILNRLRYPPFSYRRTLLRREADGEPIFRIEAPFIPV